VSTTEGGGASRPGLPADPKWMEPETKKHKGVTLICSKAAEQKAHRLPGGPF